MEKKVKCQACGRLLSDKAVIYHNHGYEDYYCTIDCLKSKVFQTNIGESTNLYFTDIDGQRQHIDLSLISSVAIHQLHDFYWIRFAGFDVNIRDSYKVDYETLNRVSNKISRYFRDNLRNGHYFCELNRSEEYRHD